MINKLYIHRSDIKDDEWNLLDPLPKHRSWTGMPMYCSYIIIANDVSLLDAISLPPKYKRIDNLPEFIEKFNEFRLFLLL